MITAASVLVVAASSRELASGPWRSLLCGVGPVEAAVATASEIARERPAAVLHVGIAGARRHSGLALGSLVIGSEARYCDLGVSAEWAPATVGASQQLVDAARRVLPAAAVLPIGTSARVGGTTIQAGMHSGAQAGMISGIHAGTNSGIQIEAMEGFAVLRAAARAGIPAIEIRAISNEIEETDRGRWHFDLAFAAITGATPALVAEIERVLRTGHA